MANAKVVHFEIPADDTTRAREFWTKMFGVEFQSYDGPIEYHMFQNDDEQSGGGLMPRMEGQEGLVIYFATEDIDATLDKVREAGGTVENEKMPVPGMGWFAHVTRHRGQSLLVLAERRERTGSGRNAVRRGGRLLEQPRGIEELELWRRPSEDGLRHELTAREPEHVSVT